MEESQGNRNLITHLPGWLKNPLVLIGAFIVIVVILYLLMPYLSTLKSPFTQYKPLPIDSTYLKLDTSSKKNPVDSIIVQKDSIQPIQDNEEEVPTDSSSIANLFRLNTDYHELDPNEQLNRTAEEAPEDLFSQLILADLDPSQIEQLQNIDFKFHIKSVLQMLSATAVEILSGIQSKYHLDIIEAIEQVTIVQGVIISNRSEKVIYATNKKFKNQHLFEIFPGLTLNSDQLITQEIDDLQLISMPVHHQYGKIGTIVLFLKD